MPEIDLTVDYFEERDRLENLEDTSTLLEKIVFSSAFDGFMGAVVALNAM